MNRTLCCFALLALALAQVHGFPESPHPYPNGSAITENFLSRGAVALEIKFSAQTFTEPGKDFIVLRDSENRVIGKYSGGQLAGLTIFVEGDSVAIDLVTDETVNAYGYSVADIRTIFSLEYFEPRQIDYTQAEQLSGEDLRAELLRQIQGHTCLGYRPAREKMFGEIDNRNGYVRCVYTARLLKTTVIPDSSNMNCEHTWPKSKGAEYDPAQSDLYHLFPTDSVTNAKRGNYAFGEVSWAEWSNGGSVLGKDSEGRIVFEPRSDHRGNVARAMFYFAVRYEMQIADYEEDVLRLWHTEDPVDQEERARNENISKYQKNRNPFIDHPEYAEDRKSVV